MLYATRCVSDAHAREVARQMCTEQFAGFEIWRGQICIDKHSRASGG